MSNIQLFRGAGNASLMPSLMQGGFFIALATGAYFLVRKIAAKIRHNRVINQYGDNTKEGKAAGYATQIFNAMFSGPEWLSDWFGDGTDEEVIISTGVAMYQNGVAFNLVSKAYFALYNRDLNADLNKELSAQERLKFDKAFQTGAGLSGLDILPQILVTKKLTHILNHKLEPVSYEIPGVALGNHLGTLIFKDGRKYFEFEYQGQARYVQTVNANLYNLR